MTVKVVDVEAIRARAKMPVLRSVMVEILRNDIPALIDALSASEKNLCNLLAVIHRDGGHYISDHGMTKAVEDALRISSERIGAEAALAAMTEERDRAQREHASMDETLAIEAKARAASEERAYGLELAVACNAHFMGKGPTPECGECLTCVKDKLAASKEENADNVKNGSQTIGDVVGRLRASEARARELQADLDRATGGFVDAEARVKEAEGLLREWDQAEDPGLAAIGYGTVKRTRAFLAPQPSPAPGEAGPLVSEGSPEWDAALAVEGKVETPSDYDAPIPMLRCPACGRRYIDENKAGAACPACSGKPESDPAHLARICEECGSALDAEGHIADYPCSRRDPVHAEPQPEEEAVKINDGGFCKHGKPLSRFCPDCSYGGLHAPAPIDPREPPRPDGGCPAESNHFLCTLNHGHALDHDFGPLHKPPTSPKRGSANEEPYGTEQHFQRNCRYGEGHAGPCVPWPAGLDDEAGHAFDAQQTIIERLRARLKQQDALLLECEQAVLAWINGEHADGEHYDLHARLARRGREGAE